MDRPFVSEGGKECQGDIGKERESEGKVIHAARVYFSFIIWEELLTK